MPNDINERMVNEDLETEDEITADPRQLYKRFEDMFIKEQQNAWAVNHILYHKHLKPKYFKFGNSLIFFLFESIYIYQNDFWICDSL